MTVALDLFAQKGFNGVSVRDICGALGLKESALYYHFRNKEALLTALYGRVDELIARMRITFDTAFAGVTEVSSKAMCAVAAGFLRNYYCDLYVSKLLAMLDIGRMSDPMANRIYQKLYYDLPLEQCGKIFSQMKERRIIGDFDTDYLAEEYLCKITFAFDRFVLGNPERDEGIRRAEEEVVRQIAIFYERIREKD